MVQRCDSTAVRWCGGAAVRRYGGAAVRRRGGAMRTSRPTKNVFVLVGCDVLIAPKI
ncbi:MAG: hypothetical protein FWH01_09140 [Oscillospiraceae bacterium]|nr:hypothetical protein [Oscillospiraceae bacterium]